MNIPVKSSQLIPSALLANLASTQIPSISSPFQTPLKSQHLTRPNMIDFSYIAFHSWDMVRGTQFDKKSNGANNFDLIGSSEHNHRVISRDVVIV